MLTPPTPQDLADFTGRPAVASNAFAGNALEQAALMFTIGTKLTDYPDEPDKAKLARFAILEMADRLLLEQAYAQIKANPFQSETIGSYSYSRATQTAKTVAQGLKTGLFWWDTAIYELTVAEQAVSAHGSIKVDIDGLVRTGPDQYQVVDEASAEADRPVYIRIS